MPKYTWIKEGSSKDGDAFRQLQLQETVGSRTIYDWYAINKGILVVRWGSRNLLEKCTLTNPTIYAVQLNTLKKCEITMDVMADTLRYFFF